MKVVLGVTCYNIKETADMLDINPLTLNGFVKKGLIPARKLGGRWHITDVNIKEYVKGIPFTDPFENM